MCAWGLSSSVTGVFTGRCDLVTQIACDSMHVKLSIYMYSKNFLKLAIQGCLKMCRRVPMFCECVVQQFICCAADIDPEGIVHSFPVNYASFINQ